MSNLLSGSLSLGLVLFFNLAFASPTCFEVHNWTQGSSIPMTINVTHTSGSSSSWGSGRSQTIHPGGWAAIGHYKDGTGNWPCPGQGFIIAGLQERYENK